MCRSDADQLCSVCGKSDTSDVMSTGDESPFKSWVFGLGLWVYGIRKNTTIIFASFPQKLLEGLQKHIVFRL